MLKGATRVLNFNVEETRHETEEEAQICNFDEKMADLMAMLKSQEKVNPSPNTVQSKKDDIDSK